MASDFLRKVVVVDDEPLIRTLIADKLSGLGFEAHSASGAIEAKKLVRQHDPDALIVDLDLGNGPNGIELITSLESVNPSLAFVLLTNFAPAQWELKVAKNLKYVKKSEVLDFSTLVTALEETLQGRAKKVDRTAGHTHNKVAKLTKNQLQVLSMIAKGKTNQEISQELAVSLGAIEQTIKRIYSALELDARAFANRRVTAAQMYSQTMGTRGFV
jgi:DNA-binding NarL/FixJ family response regulator